MKGFASTLSSTLVDFKLIPVRDPVCSTAGERAPEANRRQANRSRDHPHHECARAADAYGDGCGVGERDRPCHGDGCIDSELSPLMEVTGGRLLPVPVAIVPVCRSRHGRGPGPIRLQEFARCGVARRRPPCEGLREPVLL
jgi:hypothetical protein